MRVLHATILLATIAVAVLYIFGGAEEIVAEAKEAVPLVDANTVAGPWGTTAVTVATLEVGEKVRVTECRSRKSDIDILTVRDGMTVVIGGGSESLKLHRKEVGVWSQYGTNSCRGFFEHMSVSAMAGQLAAGAQ